MSSDSNSEDSSGCNASSSPSSPPHVLPSASPNLPSLLSKSLRFSNLERSIPRHEVSRAPSKTGVRVLENVRSATSSVSSRRLLKAGERAGPSVTWRDADGESGFGMWSLVLGTPTRVLTSEDAADASAPSNTLSSVFPLGPLFSPRRPVITPRGTRIELHVHLVGALRPQTVWELMKDKNLCLPGDGSLDALRAAIATVDPVDVYKYAKNVLVYLPAIAGDVEALERVAFELCEDKVAQGVLYVEVRYAPNLLQVRDDLLGIKQPLKLHEVVAAVTRGLSIAEAALGITARTILSVTTGVGVATDVFNICQDFKEEGVVGIDFNVPYNSKHKEYEEVPLAYEELRVFGKAAAVGLHRTVHAGFLGNSRMVQRAVEKYHAERVGHGYSVVQDAAVYARCRANDVHFECCPWESILISNGAQLFGAVRHSITIFAEDNVNFGLNTSHPTVTGASLQQEYDLASAWGLTELHLVRANLNALRSSFLPPEEKKVLQRQLLSNLSLVPASPRPPTRPLRPPACGHHA